MLDMVCCFSSDPLWAVRATQCHASLRRGCRELVPIQSKKEYIETFCRIMAYERVNSKVLREYAGYRLIRKDHGAATAECRGANNAHVSVVFSLCLSDNDHARLGASCRIYSGMVSLQDVEEPNSTKSVLASFAGDWSAEGKARHLVHGPGASQISVLCSRDIARNVADKGSCCRKHLGIDVIAWSRHMTSRAGKNFWLLLDGFI